MEFYLELSEGVLGVDAWEERGEGAAGGEDVDQVYGGGQLQALLDGGADSQVVVVLVCLPEAGGVKSVLGCLLHDLLEHGVHAVAGAQHQQGHQDKLHFAEREKNVIIRCYFYS